MRTPLSPGDRALVDGDKARADRRRADDAAVPHAGHGEIVDEDVAPAHLGRDVRARQLPADDAMLRGRAQLHLGIDLEAEAAAGQERVDLDRHAAPAAHLARDEVEIVDRGVQALGREPQQRAARRGGGAADLHAALRYAGAAGGRPLVGGQRRVALDQDDRVDADAELLGDELAQGDAQPGAEIDLAAIDGDGAVGMEREEAIDLAPVEALAERRRRGRRGARRAQGEAHDERAAARQKIAPRCLEVVRHRRRPVMMATVSLAPRRRATAASNAQPAI